MRDAKIEALLPGDEQGAAETIDELTGLAAFSQDHPKLNQMVRESANLGKHLSLIVTDCDNFGVINRTYGVATGDLLLRRVGLTLIQWAEPPSVCWRLEGDEFLVALPGVSPMDAGMWAAGLKAAVASPVTLDTGSMISVGIAAYPEDGNTPDRLIEVARRRLDEQRPEP